MKKRLLSFILSLVMVLTLLPSAAFADGEESQSFIPANEDGETYFNLRDWTGLPGGGFDIGRWDGYGEKSDGEAFEYEIVNVEPVSDDWGRVIELEKGEDGDYWWWHIQALDIGTAVLKITAKKLNGRTWSYEINVNVTADVYNMDIYTETGQDYYLSGEQFLIWVNPKHESVDEKRQGDLSKVTYNWYVEDNKAEITPLKDEPTKAQVSLPDLPAEKEEEGIIVRVEMYDENAAMVARTGWVVFVRHDYSELYPTRINEDMTPLSTEPVSVELRDYSENRPGFDTRKGIEFRWYYDPDCVEVLDVKGNRVGGRVGEYAESDYAKASDETGTCDFTIRRLKEWGTDIRLLAVERDEKGDWHEISSREYRLNDRFINVWSEEHDVEVFTDSEILPAIIFNVDDPDWESWLDIGIRAGYWNFDHWEDFLTEGKDYTVGKEQNRIIVTLTDSYMDSLREDTSIRICAEPYLKGADHTEENRMSDPDGWIHIHIARVEYEMERDRHMLPGWDGSIDGSMTVWIRNSRYPDGQDLQCKVLNVEKISDKPRDPAEGDVVTDFHRDSDERDPGNYWWDYSVEHLGEAVFRVTYQNPDELGGTADSYEFSCYVGTDVYNVGLRSINGEREAFPGGQIGLYASAEHEYVDEQGQYHCDSDGLGYEWFFEYGEAFGVLAVDDNDPSRAVLMFNDLPAGWDDIGEGVRVGVRILNAKGEETEGYDAQDFRVETEYKEIRPLMLDGDIDLGDALENIKFEVRRYRYNENTYEVLDDKYDVRYEWYYDQNALRITENVKGKTVEVPNGSAASGNTFTFTRLGDLGTWINVKAFWENDRGEYEDEWGQYYFSDKDYRIWFDDDHADVFDDYETTLTVNTQNLGKLAYDLDYEVRVWLPDQDRWEDCDERSGVYSVEGPNITFYGPKMAEMNADYAEVRAVLIYGGRERGDAWAGVDLKKSCGNHVWTKVTTPATLEGDGSLLEVCTNDNCGEERMTVIPKVGTLKLSKTSYTYNTKVQKPSVTVKDRTGKAISKDFYTVTYQDKNSTDAGTYKVTVRFKGNYAGYKTLKYSIKKADNSITRVTSSATIDAKKLKKKDQSFKISATVKEKAKKTFKLTSVPSAAKKYIKVSSTGKVTVKKGLKPGTYKIKVRITAAETKNYKKTTATKSIKIKVK